MSRGTRPRAGTLLTPLLARGAAGWYGLIGVGALMVWPHERWSYWRVSLESIGLWQAALLLAAAANSSDFAPGSGWYLLAVALALLIMAALYIGMEYIAMEYIAMERRRGS